MTKIQIESIGTVTVAMGVSGHPFIQVESVTAAGSCRYTPLEYSFARLQALVEKGYALNDPNGIVTCPGCGALKLWTQVECDACAADEDNRRDDRQMHNDLRGGM